MTPTLETNLNRWNGRRGHKLLTAAILKRFAQVGDQDTPDPIVIVKFFHCLSNWTWYATAYNPEDQLFFGRVDGHYSELGYFSLEELSGLVNGLPFERDCHFEECHLSTIPAHTTPWPD